MNNAICIPITGPSVEKAAEQVMRADKADLIEVRCDQIEYGSVEELAQLLGRRPAIFTLKGAVERKIVLELMELEPDYVDIEVEQFLQLRPLIPAGVKVIASYHDHEKTPDDLEALFLQMEGAHADLYKIATFAKSSVDALRMLKLCKAHPNLIGICMGSAGIATRVLGCVFGAPWTYGALDKEHKSAPGQLPVDQLCNQYHFKSLTQKTRILGVMGNPVERSPGVPAHNEIYERLSLDAVYLPFTLNAEDLSDFFPLALELGFYGMSVTMPLKEAVLPYLEEKGEVGAVNTLIRRGEHFDGANFDGVGAVDAIAIAIGSVEGKRVILIGAGGAAAAIAFEAKKRGATVCILNRTPERAQMLAMRVGCAFGTLEHPLDGDVVIQCTSAGMEPHEDTMPVSCDSLPSDAVVLEIITRPKDTLFLKAAKAKGCTTIYGTEMWKRQAAHQLALWFDLTLSDALQIINEIRP